LARRARRRLFALRQRRAEECSIYKSSPLFSRSITLPPTRRHDVHIADDIRTVSNFDRHLDHGDPTGPIEKGMTYMVRLHAALYSASMAGFQFVDVDPVICRPGFIFIFRADKVRAPPLRRRWVGTE